MIKNNFFTTILKCGLVSAVVSCSSVQDNTDNTLKAVADTSLVNKLNEIYYAQPTPSEMLNYFDDEGISFMPNVTNPVSNKDNYIEPIEKILNIGVYSSDIAYQILFEKISDVAKTFDAIDDLSNEANFRSAMDENMKSKITNNSVNLDSLTKFSNEVYLNTAINIKKSGKQNDYIILSAGSFVETIYLLIQSLKSSENAENTERKIIEQKILFDDLYSVLTKLKEDKNMLIVLSDFKEVKTAFDLFSINSKNAQMNKTKEGKLLLSGKNEIIYSKESFNKLKNALIRLRTKWT